MLKPTSAIMGKDMGDKVAFITDGRFSGGSHGFVVGHITPEAAKGGLIGLLEDGDEITIDAIKGRIDANLSDEEIEKRKNLGSIQNLIQKRRPFKIRKSCKFCFIRSDYRLKNFKKFFFHHNLYMSEIIELNDENFEEQLSATDKPVLVDYWAEWCGPCKMVAPILEELSGELEDKLVIGKLDVDNNKDSAIKQKVMSIPR